MSAPYNPWSDWLKEDKTPVPAPVGLADVLRKLPGAEKRK